MGSRGEKDRAKQIQDRCQSILVQLLKDEDNKYCVDCDAKGPRWASWNLGIFLCIRCAGIHRNLGVHISKVKSVNLDAWTPEQVVSLQQMGNSRARAVYEANLPDSFRRPQNDTALEAFIRAKYEQKKYIAKEWVQPPPPKVNWDKEIDEEIERQKKKKKSSLAPLPTALTTDKKYAKSDVIPQLLPKPKSSVSPKLNRSTPAAASEPRPSNGAADLLGLDSGSGDTKPAPQQDDIFSNFFSAPQDKPPADEPPKNDLKMEEQNFFNQPAPTEKEKSKMTKDSILALYGQTPSNAANQFPAPSGQFPQQFGQFQQQQGFASFNQNGAQANQFNQTSAQNQFSQTSSQNQFNPMLQQNQFSQSQPNQFNQPQPNQFSQSTFNQGFGQFSQPSQFQNQQFGQFGAHTFNQNQFANGSQFAGNATQQPMAQQFSNMSLGQNAFAGAFPPPQNANVTSNTWQ